tara:strand:+ start:985 stop:1497 length:513 start_codon:yes stop_codon:yes gene_type:complete
MVTLVFLQSGMALAENKNPRSEKHDSGWSFHFDNDIFTGTDRNYTGGLAVSVFGKQAVESSISLDSVLQGFNTFTGIDSLWKNKTASSNHAQTWGTLLFTPEDISSASIIPSDRPYACLVFADNSEQNTLYNYKAAYQTSLTVGILGTDFCRTLQNGLHRVFGSDQPNGW